MSLLQRVDPCHDDAVESTLGAQLQVCRLYLDLMSLRTGRLSYEVTADDALSAEPFPPFLLVTLVDYARRGGLLYDGKRKPPPATLPPAAAATPAE